MKRSIVVAALVALTAAPAFADATGDVRAAMIRFAALKSYEMTAGGGRGESTVIDVVNPDGMRMNAGGMEMVRVGTTMYVKMPGQSWRKMPDVSGGAAGTHMADRVRALASAANGMTVRDLGMKNADGQSMHAYDLTQKDGSKAVVYIARDGMVHRIDPKGGQSGTEPIRFSKFNAVAPIRAPM